MVADEEPGRRRRARAGDARKAQKEGRRLRKHWVGFSADAGSLPEGEAGTGLTNDS